FDRPIIALTANAMKQDERRCLESGCDDYLSKPLSRATLVSTLAYYTTEVSLEELAARREAYGFRASTGGASAQASGEGESGSAGGDASGSGAEPSRGDPSGGSPPKTARCVLLVDDNKDSCSLLRMLLEAIGCEAETAVSAEEALAIADRRPVDIAVIDLGLPDMPGEELVGVLRGKLEHCRFICLSGRRESEIDWRAAGFDHFVQKPARFERLKALILEG